MKQIKAINYMKKLCNFKSLFVMITLIIGLTSCHEDIEPERPIRWFPVQILTIDCDPSDVNVLHKDVYYYILYREGVPVKVWFKDKEEISYEEAHYGVSDIVKYLNEDYASSNIQFYEYSPILSISWNEYIETGDGETINTPYSYLGYLPYIDTERMRISSRAIIISLLNNEEYWAQEAIKRGGPYVIGLGGNCKVEINFGNENRNTIRHEMDHVFGWKHGSGIDYENYPRIPSNLYDYSFTQLLNPLASDRPL